ncbi:MAG: CBS domain-containing protein, partial [Motiliproteus sp.]|nr:CBS domain-containing protein [Motiliproteus sp.]
MNVRSAKAIAAIVQQQVVTCQPDMALQDVSQLMRDQSCSSIIVTENEQPIGIWTEADALKIDFSNTSLVSTPIRNWMSSPVKTIHHQLS